MPRPARRRVPLARRESSPHRVPSRSHPAPVPIPHGEEMVRLTPGAKGKRAVAIRSRFGALRPGVEVCGLRFSRLLDVLWSRFSCSSMSSNSMIRPVTRSATALVRRASRTDNAAAKWPAGEVANVCHPGGLPRSSQSPTIVLFPHVSAATSGDHVSAVLRRVARGRSFGGLCPACRRRRGTRIRGAAEIAA